MTQLRVCEDCGATFFNVWAHAEECTGPRMRVVILCTVTGRLEDVADGICGGCGEHVGGKWVA